MEPCCILPAAGSVLLSVLLMAIAWEWDARRVFRAGVRAGIEAALADIEERERALAAYIRQAHQVSTLRDVNATLQRN